YNVSILKRMKPYELTYIFSSETDSETAASLKKEVEVFVQGRGGLIVTSEKTLPQSLAYPIKKHRSGYFVTLEFLTEEKEIKPLKEMLEKNTGVLRHFLIIKKPIKAMKERRTRKPLAARPEILGAKQTAAADAKTKTEKVELGDIDKKLDEILSQ
ncbi:MAG: 30S ribosomal protein S6, partial [Candidatus Paceibacterales bacterium]